MKDSELNPVNVVYKILPIFDKKGN